MGNEESKVMEDKKSIESDGGEEAGSQSECMDRNMDIEVERKTTNQGRQRENRER